MYLHNAASSFCVVDRLTVLPSQTSGRRCWIGSTFMVLHKSWLELCLAAFLIEEASASVVPWRGSCRFCLDMKTLGLIRIRGKQDQTMGT